MSGLSYWYGEAGEEYQLLVDAALDEDLNKLAKLLDSGVDINLQNEQGETAFSYCCANNKLLAAKFLQSRGARINTIDKAGGSPLDWAVCWSSPEFREWLVSVGGVRNDDTYEPWPWPPKEGEGDCCSEQPGA